MAVEYEVALIAAGVSLVVAAIGHFAAWRRQEAQLKAAREAQEAQIKAAREAQEEQLKAAREAQEDQFKLQENRLRTELKTEHMAEEAIHELLSIKNWEQRSFGAIKFRIRGFSDNELRQLLVRAGAIAIGGRGDAEFWGLKDKPINQKALLEGSPEADAAPETHSEVRPQPGSNTPDESPQDR